MTKWFSLLSLVAVFGLAHSQDKPDSTTSESTRHSCELTQEDYAVFAALLNGLHGPEDPEEAGEGKEILIVDVTATPENPESQRSGLGLPVPVKRCPFSRGVQ